MNKKLFTIIVILLCSTIFILPNSAQNTRKGMPKNTAGTLYVYITDTEWDKAYDEPSKNGYVNLVSDIVTVNCEITDRSAVSQYIDHYNAQERSKTRDRALNVTNAWSYRSFDEAYKKRREWMAKFNQNERKRIISNLYLTCK